MFEGVAGGADAVFRGDDGSGSFGVGCVCRLFEQGVEGLGDAWQSVEAALDGAGDSESPHAARVVWLIV